MHLGSSGSRRETFARLAAADARRADGLDVEELDMDALSPEVAASSRAAETPKYPPVTVSEHYLGKLMRAGHSKVDAKAADALTH